jgi:hypothetical protein
MLNFFLKMALIIMLVNSFLFFVLGIGFGNSFDPTGGLAPSSLNKENADANKPLTDSNLIAAQGFSDVDSNSTIQASGTAGGVKTVQKLYTFVQASGFIYDALLSVMFGYAVWTFYIFPGALTPIAYALAIAFLFFQAIGLFYFLQIIVSTLGIANILRSG